MLVRRRFASELQFDEGERIGPYQIIRRIAPSCYDAEALASCTPIRIELASEDDSALIDVRFSRARAQLELVDHPCVAQILDHGVLGNGRPWVASHRPAGTALSDVLAKRRLEVRETCALVYSVASVLAYAHKRQVVHGSLRPHHLTLSRGAKVSISGWAWLRTPGIPAFGDPASTSVYNPPEHDGQSPIDGRADVYALGAIAYRALTGVFPDVSRDLIDPRTPLGAVIEGMLAPDARDRLSAASVVADLHEQRRADRASSQELEQRRRASSPSPASLAAHEPADAAQDLPTTLHVAAPPPASPSMEMTAARAPAEATEVTAPIDPTDPSVAIDVANDDLEERCTNRMASQDGADATDTRVDVVS